MAVDWFFEPVGELGGAIASAFQNPLAGAGERPEDLLAREAIQNSCDAAVNRDKKVTVRFRRTTLDRSAAKRFWKALRLTAEPRTRGESLGQEGRLARAPNDLDLLYIEDYGTHGLGGGLNQRAGSSEDRFRRLCLELGVDEPATGRGGTFGYGKSVYWAASAFRTVVVYSRFKKKPNTSGNTARLMAISWFNSHEWEKTRYTGRAFFGELTSGTCRPVVDREAHRIAKQLGFKRRGPESRGTSILVVGSTIASLDTLRRGVETSWWPRILDEKLDVEILHQGAPADAPDPRLRKDIAPFIRCYEVLTGRMRPTAREAQGTIEHRDRKLGTWAASAELDLPAESRTNTDDDEDTADLARPQTVALLRAPRMVLEYHRIQSAGTVPFTSVFVADPEMERTLQLCEPPAHNKWDPNTARKIPDEERVLVKEGLRKLRDRIRDFARKLEPAPAEPPARCRELEKLLSKYLPTAGPPTPPGPGPNPQPPPPPPEPAVLPVGVEFLDGPNRVMRGSDVVITARIRVAPGDDASEGDEGARWCVRFQAMLLGDDTRSVLRSPDFRMATIDVLRKSKKTKCEIVNEEAFVRFEADGFAEFEIASSPLPDPECMAEVDVEIALAGGES